MVVGVEVLNEGFEVLGAWGVEVAGGFIEQKQGGIVEQSRSDAHALKLAAGEGAKRSLGEVGNAEAIKFTADAVVEFARDAAEPRGAPRMVDGQKLRRGERKRAQNRAVLGNVTGTLGISMTHQFPAGGPVDAGEGFEQRGFPHAIGAGDAQQFAALHGAVKVIDDPVRAVAEG
jgi:hypothetical protein